MRKSVFLALAFTLAVLSSVSAQPSALSGPGIDRMLAKLFGNNDAFTADIVLTETLHGDSTTMPGKMAFSAGQLRVEVDLGTAKAPRMKPENFARLKAAGLDKAVDISRPDKKTSYFLYPNASAYVETPLQNANAGPDGELKVSATELGKETLDGHPCIKSKVVITDDHGTSHESTVWNATDLKKFPIKIEMAGQDRATIFAFSHVKFGKPDSALFEVPAGYKKYDNKAAVMMEQMRKQMGNKAMPTNHP